MSQNIKENRMRWPKEVDSYVVADKTVDSSKVWEPPSAYPKGGKYQKVRAWTFRSGQSVEVDETPDGERIRIINTDGSYVEMQPDGTYVHRANGSTHEVVVKDKNVRVKGAMHVQIDGDANVKIVGNVQAQVGGSLTAQVSGLSKLDLSGGTELTTPFLRIFGNEVSHNGINIGDTHKHRDVVPGSGISGIPLPF